MSNNNIRRMMIALGIGAVLGWFVKGEPVSTPEHQYSQGEEEHTAWTCSMHPQIQQPDFGKCPLCGMDLIPLADDSEEDSPFEIKMSKTAMQLANVQTSFVQRKKAEKETLLHGKIKVAENQKYAQTSHVSGRVERLMIGFTGDKIQQGDVLAWVYSPELLTAQKELIEAWKTRDNMPQLYRAARVKLQGWKLSEKQIDQIVEKGSTQELLPIYADVSGTILRKNIALGDYLQKGQTLFEVADLSSVWASFDIYESDLSWITAGDMVHFQVKSLPEQEFSGEVSFIDPVINPKTRAAAARVSLSNADESLRPEQLITGRVHSRLRTEEEALVVPKSAVMWTGKRSIVYSKKQDNSGVYFVMKNVLLGASLGREYIILEGLEEGEEIATNGTFSIDAAAQLVGKASMMNAEEKKDESSDVETNSEKLPFSDAERTELKPLFFKYIELKTALVNDDFQRSQASILDILEGLNRVDITVFKEENRHAWMSYSEQIREYIQQANEAKNIAELRAIFKPLSRAFIDLVKTIGSIDTPLFVEYCPMAENNTGADWLSTEAEIRNPYFGASMLGCGEVKEELR